MILLLLQEEVEEVWFQVQHQNLVVLVQEVMLVIFQEEQEMLEVMHLQKEMMVETDYQE